jgi:rubredoxin
MTSATVPTIVCGYCGLVFAEDRGQPACRACPIGDACGLVRCPSCGYENPLAPAWLQRLRRMLSFDESR